MTKKKKILISVFAVIAALILIATAVVIISFNRGYGATVGRALVTDGGSYLLIDENSPIEMSTKSNKEDFFKDIKTGDKILVIHDGINETYPGETRAYLCIKLSEGTINDIDKNVISELSEMGWISAAASGVTIEKRKIDPPKANVVADMIAFFIYNNRSYVSYETIDDAQPLIGEYLGRASGSIDEWSDEDDYVNFSGSVSGDIYTVNGMDKEFMLCINYGDGSITTYINDNDITLTYGSELFSDRLHLKDNYTVVKYQTRDNWYYDKSEPIEIENYDIITRFVEALDNAPFMYLSDIPLSDSATDVYSDKEIYHLFFEMKNGMTVHLRVFSGGYVSFSVINNICVKIDTAIFEELINNLK